MSNSEPEIMDEGRKIKIDFVTGGNHKDNLKQCFFYPTVTRGEYNFYNKDGRLLYGGITSGSFFTFSLDNVTGWTIGRRDNPNFFIISDEFATGSWSNPDPANEQDGTFQAQAGGGAGEEESASSATA